ncbi:MAG: response regulator [Candidatus Omnitrophica bacterium]|nr:response regulator [Candidatus Omnitrophota bacterium]
MGALKVLIVDDEKEFSDSISKYLKSLNYEVFNTYTGEQALEILERERPHVLLCDLKLSGIGSIDGDDVLERLKPISPDTIPVIITAYRDESTQRKLTSKGALRILFKPIRLEEVDNLLREVEDNLDKR